MGKSMRQLQTVESAEALRALADPNRLAILRQLMAAPQTISSLGALFDRHPAWIRHHVKALEAAGLVALHETRTTRNYTEKFYRAESSAFTVSMLIRPGAGSPVAALVSSDFAVELLVGDEGHPDLAAAVTGSLDGLIGVRQGLADIAGCHLLDSETGEYNVPFARHLFPDRDVVVVTLAHREQGLIVGEGNRLGLTGVADVVERGARFVNRNRGSGTRLWLDSELRRAGIASSAMSGYDRVVDTHSEAARAIAEGSADAAVGISAAAAQFGLQFIPLFRERYDLVMLRDAYESEQVERVIERLHTRAFKRSVSALTGYDTAATGDEHRLAI